MESDMHILGMFHLTVSFKTSHILHKLFYKHNDLFGTIPMNGV